MPRPNSRDLLTVEEVTALNQALANERLLAALHKIFAFDGRVHAESMENEALSPEPSTQRLVQSATRCRAAREWLTTIKTRMAALVLPPRAPEERE